MILLGNDFKRDMLCRYLVGAWENIDRTRLGGNIFIMMLSLVKSMRPRQWVKNLVVFLPLVFSINEAWSLSAINEQHTLELLSKNIIALVSFIFACSAVYMLNDLLDAESDRNHDSKKSRPIAAGEINVTIALVTAVLFAVVALLIASLVNTNLFYAVATYMMLMVAYSLFLREIMILDIFAISAGFVIRVVAGALAINIPVSPWLYVCMGFGALFIALSKRHAELNLTESKEAYNRTTLQTYSLGLIETFITLALSTTLISYILYTFTAPNLPDNNAMMVTIPVIVYGTFRYLYLVKERCLGEKPEDVLITDRPLIICVMFWLAVTVTVLYFFR